MAFINYLRSILVLLFVVPASTLLTIFWVVVGILLFRVSTSRIKAAPRWWSRVIARSFGVKVEVAGLENLEPGRPYILVANHQSQFDIFALDGYLMVDFRWMAKKELFRIPLVGWGMRLAGSIPIDRSHGRQAMKSLAEAAERIAAGTSVVIFPEGTRTRDGNLQPFKSGGMYLAIKSGVDVAPVALVGGYDVLPKGRFLPRPGRIMIRVGRPVSSRDFSQKQKQALADLLHDQVAALIEEAGPVRA
ncbi:MAG: lysophospholipid acyltransferase family protein [Desulfurivibrionaceae bacterium]|nr:lysophospholipid acyltransferase family protein [Desulfobulbales bacterium]MDT8334988.1 lysophospholipid acyltransferase family protein [Desulfurivibrionaceae bacterium]